tara:strand:+ start:637 stop:1041 length:405 start_codon:yes stop_codon:yes gene_type:complete
MPFFVNKRVMVATALFTSLALTSGCAATQGDDMHEARATSITASQKQAIENTISEWFGGVKITVTDDVFSQSSKVTIERKAQMDSRGLPIDGRHNNPIFSFTLLTNGKQCLLRNEQTGELATLDNVACEAAPKV